MLKLNLSAFYFFYFALTGVFIIFLPKALYDIGYSSGDIGLIFSVAALMRFITPFFFLKYFHLDISLYVKSLFLFIIAVATSYLTIDNFWLYLVTIIGFGTAVSLILPYVEAIALDKLDKSTYGRIRLFGSIGFMLIAVVVAKFDIDTIVIIHSMLLLTILTSLFAFIITKYDTVEVEGASGDEFSLKESYPLWISLFLMQLSFGAYYNFFTIYETDRGVSLVDTSYLWSIGVVAEIVMLYFQGPILKRYSLLLLIKLSVLITVVRWSLTYFFASNIYILYFAQTLHAFSFALYHTSVIMFLFMMYRQKRLAQQFFLGIAYGLGGAVGSIVAGWLYGDYLFLSSAIMALLSYLFLLKR